MADLKWADVAHYYLRSGIKCNVSRGDLTGKQGDWRQTVEKFGAKHLRVNSDGMTFWCVPILRHLDDMFPDFYDRTPTKEEDDAADLIWKELWGIIFPESTQEDNADVFEQKSDGYFMLRRGRERLFLHEGGGMYADFDGKGISFSATAVTRLLVSHGFNIFGLEWGKEAIRKEVGNG